MPIKSKWIQFSKHLIEALAIEEPGVYEIGKARGNVVLYIGKSETSIRSRLLYHKRLVAFRECTHFRKRRSTRQAAPRAEEILLSEYRKRHGKYPKLNKNKPPGEDWLTRYYWR
jgi:hypothetical protein